MPSQSNQEELVYIKPEERIYDVATNKDVIDWKSFLYELIHKEGLNPWDIDLSLLTNKYIQSLKELKDVDFDVSGKFLTVAVFLLKTKTETLLERDIRGIEDKIAQVQSDSNGFDELDALEGLDLELDEIDLKKKKYVLKYRNPIARKRKVTIFDLIKTLEKTFEQSNRRRTNFFQRSGDTKYDGPMYEKRPKDLKQLIEELYDLVKSEFSSKKGHLCFNHLVDGLEEKMEILDRFIPLLHLHNNSKLKLKQEEHFGDINISPCEDEE
ncbi:MAG: segregation/condensation protein A [Candidatus Woesearchaeota archaeon]|jgi:segregation and condensation protein A|nr:segregation/condensation protein A [Candidatus Woesearchaeota archaeon]